MLPNIGSTHISVCMLLTSAYLAHFLTVYMLSLFQTLEETGNQPTYNIELANLSLNALVRKVLFIP